MIVWLNGVLRPADEARIDPTDRGFTLGDGLFETILGRDGQGVRLDAHFDRLRRGAELLGLPVPLTEDRLAEAVSAVLGANGLSEAAVRLTLTAGPGPRGLSRPDRLSPTLLMTAGPLPQKPPGPVRLTLARGTRRNPASPLSRVKSLGYLDNLLAKREAVAAGADDALMLNTEGRIACATAANIFAWLDGVWQTPPVGEGALPGVRRAELLASGAAVERPLTVEDVRDAERLLLTTALTDREARLLFQ